MSLLNKKAPDFTLTNTEGEKLSLADLTSTGKASVLLFFPLAYTSVCTAELCSMRDNLKNYEALNANVYGVSVDSFFTLREFAKSQELNFPLLSDFNKDVAKAFGSLYEDFLGLKGVAKRSAFVLDAEGTVVYEEVNDDAAKLPDFEKIVEALNALQK
jgi:peroxiredoxin